MSKKTYWFFGLIAVAAAGAYLLNRVDDIVQNLKVSFQSLKVKTVNFTGAALTLSYNIANNNQFPITVNWVKGNIWYGNTAVATIEVPQGQQLTNGETKVLNTEISIKWLDTAGDLFEILRNAGANTGVNPYKTFVARGQVSATLKERSYIVPFEQVLRLADN